MYELFQRVCTTITNISSFFWPQTRLVNTAKRPRDQIVDITEDDDDDVVICSSKKLKLFNTHLPDDTSHMKSAKTQTEGMTRKRAEKARPWRFQLSSKENWQAPIEVVDLVEETPNKFKSLYRPPQHVRSPHRVRRKSIGGTKHKVEINNGINSSNDNKLSPKSINPKNILKNSWPTDLTTMAYKQSRSSLSQNDDAVASFQRSNCLQKELDHDAYSKMLNSYIRKEPQPLQTATNTGVTVDLTADSEEELASSSGVTTRSVDRVAKLLEGDNNSAGVSNSTLDKKGPNRRRVRPSLAGIEVNISRSRQIISLDDDDDDDEEDDDDSVQFIKTPSVPKVNSLEDKIKAKSLVADQDWTSDIMRQYEDKKAEMEEMIKMLSMELKIASERNRNNFNDYTVRLLSRHLEITESVLDEALPQLTQEMLCVVKKATRKDPANEVLISKYNYNIKRADVHTLTGLNWLNDEVINFYITLITERSKENSSLPKCYSFSTFFYLRLLNSGYSGVRRWTRKIDIFAHDLILIPVHLKMHWCLAAIDFVNRTINYYDSMGTTNDQCLNKLEEYIIEEYKDKKGEQFNMEAWSKNNVKDIPQQMNGSDCGVFCCTFAEFLSRRAKFTFLQKDMPEIRQKMIYEIVTGKLLT
ncbi:uncharacterized protein isoform X2 [Rhodnius prolixus]|uniref:uncharacterized protein isoform X2 n=1 Tax=Rhodnius prolixus TaxID=13249 RepID=UPI003D18776B